MMRMAWSICALLLCCTPVAGEHLAQRMGLGAQARLLILHGDDLGLCRAANRAAERAFDKGVMSSGSVMVPCPWFPQIADWAGKRKAHDLGLHLTLTAEWKHYRWGPVTPRAQVAGLLDPQGFLWRRVEDVVKHATIAEVKQEIRAQIRRARAFGLEPTHVDSHMGTLFAHPGFFMAYLEVAREERVVPMVPRITGKRAAELQQKGLLTLARMMIEATSRRGYPVIDRLESTQGKTYALRKAWLLRLVAKLQPGVTQVILHPAEGGDELRHITNSHRARHDDLELLLDPELRQALQRHGVRLIGWKEINQWWLARREK